MKNSIIIVCVFVLLVLSLVSFGNEPAEQQEKINWRSVAGIIIQIVLFLVFLAAIYYVFIYPETPEGGKVQKEDEEETGKDTGGGGNEEGDGKAEDTEQGE